MKLDPTVMRTMDGNDFRVLESIERGMQYHAIVPLSKIHILATSNGLRHGGTHKIISSLLRDKLLSHECPKQHGSYDGYRLTNAGYDILALHQLKLRGFVVALGQQIGTGKESDIYLAANPQGRQIVLKFHRLGRTSFRNVKKKRDYFTVKQSTKKHHQQQPQQQQPAHSWLFLSRLSALKEFAFMKALHQQQFPTPTPIAHNRHVVCMSLVRGMPLYQIPTSKISAEQAADIYHQAVTQIAARLAKHCCLVHCDLNEFNLLVDLSGIQAQVTDDVHDPFVRHSGYSVVSSNSKKKPTSVPRLDHVALSGGSILSRPAWQQSLSEVQHDGDLYNNVGIDHDSHDDDDTGAVVLPQQQPAAFLSNGEPKPIVTLIDFPQMISIFHPNAQELYEHDIACLRRFIQVKLRMQIPDDHDDVVASWQSIMAIHEKNRNASVNNDDDDEAITMIPQRLDAELRASGYAPDTGHGLELYYFDSLADNRMVESVNDNTDTNSDNNPDNNEDDDDVDNNNRSDDHQDDKDTRSDDDLNNDEDGSDFEHNTDEDCQRQQQGQHRHDNSSSNRLTVVNNDNEEGVVRSMMHRQQQQQQQQQAVIDIDDLSLVTRSQQMVVIQERVRRQIQEERRKGRQERFPNKKKNNNKLYVRGKRIFAADAQYL